MALRYLAPALAIASGAAAATCSVAGTTTVTNSVQASSLASCQTFTGSIAIATGASSIALDGIDRIEGSLIAKDSSTLTSLSADSLTRIDDTFLLEDDTVLSTLTFPDLTYVGEIYWVGLAGLYGLSFSTGVSTSNTVYIDNTQLESLDGIDLTTVGAMVLTNNRYLTSVDMSLTNVTKAPGLSVSANGRSFSLSLANLQSAEDLDIHNVTTLDIASLSSVSGTLGFYDNFFTSISCPNLTSVGKELAIVGNADLTTVTMDELRTIEGGFLIVNNTKYHDVDFPKLTTVGGAIDFGGTFTSVKLADLNTVRGAFTLKSTKDISADCKHFDSIHGSNNVIQGSITCVGSDSKATTAGGSAATGSSSASASASATKSSSANSGVLASGATGILGVIAAIFGLL